MTKLLALLLIWHAASKADERWVRLRSPEFEVLTNAGAGVGRDVCAASSRSGTCLNPVQGGEVSPRFPYASLFSGTSRVFINIR